jgi:hypothetical protein
VEHPAVHFGLSGAGSNAWYGWPDVPELERLVTHWVRTTDETKRSRLAEEVQKVALDEVTYVPWGEWFQPTAFRKNIRDLLRLGAPILGMRRSHRLIRVGVHGSCLTVKCQRKGEATGDLAIEAIGHITLTVKPRWKNHRAACLLAPTGILLG